jgi:superfamily II DNA helicase RecQ
MLVDWGIRYPHDWQICAIHNVAFGCDWLVYLVAKTGSGKSAVPMTVGSLQMGVTLTMVPLVGLGSDQVNKCQSKEREIEGYHLDENRGEDGILLRSRLLALTDRDANSLSIFLYASPQSLSVGSMWHRTLMTLSSKSFIRLIVIDEAHCIAQDGRDFRPEFRAAMMSLKQIHENSPNRCNRIAMSATFRRDDQEKISDLWTRMPDSVIWHELSRRGITFNVRVSGTPSATITRCLIVDYRDPTDLKTIVYTNSKTAALGSLTDSLEKVLETCEEQWRKQGHTDIFRGMVIAMTGDDGVQMKVFTMHAFALERDYETEGEHPLLPNLV